jgi:hypothetical protein
VQLQKGANHLLIRSDAPPQGLVWRVQARLVNRGSFNRGEMAYPRWQFSAPPPWTLDPTPVQARWGDPAIEAYLRQPARPIGIQITLDSESGATPARMQAAVGQPVILTPPDPKRAAILTLNAHFLSTTATATTSDTLALSPLAEMDYTLLLGDAATLLVVKEARLLAESTRVAEPVRARLRAMLALLDSAIAPNSHPAGLDHIIGGLLFQTARIKAPQTLPESGWTFLEATDDTRSFPYALWIPAPPRRQFPRPTLADRLARRRIQRLRPD